MARIITSNKSGFIRRDGARKRDTIWIFGQIGEQGVSAGQVFLLTSLNAAALALRPFTITRTRGMMLVHSDQSAASERQIGGYGHAVVSDQAVAIGVTAVPTPITDQASDLWFLYELYMQFKDFGTAVGADNIKGTAFDSKAQRKVEDGQDVISTLEGDAISDGATFSAGWRMLLKLH